MCVWFFFKLSFLNKKHPQVMESGRKRVGPTMASGRLSRGGLGFSHGDQKMCGLACGPGEGEGGRSQVGEE